jgi:hypothetical protein
MREDIFCYFEIWVLVPTHSICVSRNPSIVLCLSNSKSNWFLQFHVLRVLQLGEFAA